MGETGLAINELNYDADDKRNIVEENDPLSQGEIVDNRDLNINYNKIDDNLISKIKNLIPAHNDNKMYRQKVPTFAVNEDLNFKNKEAIETHDLSPYHSYDKYIFSYRDLKNPKSTLTKWRNRNYTLTYGPHILLLSILFAPIAFAISFLVSLYYSSLTIYNYYEYYLGQNRRHPNNINTAGKAANMLLLVLLTPIFATFCGIFSGLYSAFYQVSCDFFVWRQEFLDPEKGFYGFICDLIGFPHCCPYDITLARETRNIQRNLALNSASHPARFGKDTGFRSISTINTTMQPNVMNPDNPYYNQCVQQITTLSGLQTNVPIVSNYSRHHTELEDHGDVFKKSTSSKLTFNSSDTIKPSDIMLAKSNDVGLSTSDLKNETT